MKYENSQRMSAEKDMKNISPIQSIFRTLLYELSLSYNNKSIIGYTRICKSIKLFTQLPQISHAQARFSLRPSLVQHSLM